MSRISAAQNLTIEIEANRWRLLTNGDGPERVLVEAVPGEPLRYLPLFASKRHLPDIGVLPVERIQRVVLGWSGSDGAWHLGLMLDPDLAEMRGSRWCEMAQWGDPDRSRYGGQATEAGERLAESVSKPFNLIPPREAEAAPTVPLSPPSVYETVESAPAAPSIWSAQAPAAIAPMPTAPAVVEQRELPSLPIQIDQWTLESIDDRHLQLKLAGSWARSRLLRIVWYLFWAVIYVGLSVLTLRGTIALPKPELLPYLGLASAVVLVLMVFYTLGELFSRVNRVVFDGVEGTVRGLHGNSERWRVETPDLQGIYVSQVVSKRAKADKRTVHHSEINLQCYDRFVFLVANLQTETRSGVFDSTPLEDAVMPLTPNLVYTDMQAAAAHMARALGVPGWYDQHLR